MTHGYDEGQLRAYLDNELPAAEHEAVEQHLAACTTCQEQVRRLREQSDHIALLLNKSTPTPDPHAALNRFNDTLQWRQTLQKKTRFLSGTYRKLAAAAAVVVVMVGLLALEPVRAAADQLLQIFRVQQVIFMPISADRMAQLEELDFDGDSLFVGEPEPINDPGEPYAVETLDEAAATVGFTPEEPTELPGTPTETAYTVLDRGTFQFQVNAEASQQLIEMLGITDVTIPAALGEEPITVDMQPSVSSEYSGDDYTLILHQGLSPQVTMPEGLEADELSQLGYAALRVLGMEQYQAEALSQEVDWSSTLLFPFPADMESIRQVTINGAPGILISSDVRYKNDDGADEHDTSWQVYWQDNDRFYVLQGMGDGVWRDEVLSAAQSVR